MVAESEKTIVEQLNTTFSRPASLLIFSPYHFVYGTTTIPL